MQTHNLQNPKDKRQILLDDALQKVFKVKKFTMFTLNKHVAKHVYIEEEPRSPVKKAPKKKATVASKSKAPAKAKAKGKGKKGEEDDGKPKKPKKPINHPKFKLSADMAAVTGTTEDSRPGITKALWAYIRANNLQKPENKSIIICDANFKKVMGGGGAGHHVLNVEVHWGAPWGASLKSRLLVVYKWTFAFFFGFFGYRRSKSGGFVGDFEFSR